MWTSAVFSSGGRREIACGAFTSISLVIVGKFVFAAFGAERATHDAIATWKARMLV